MEIPHPMLAKSAKIHFLHFFLHFSTHALSRSGFSFHRVYGGTQEHRTFSVKIGKEIAIRPNDRGQLISNCLFGVIVLTKKPTKIL